MYVTISPACFPLFFLISDLIKSNLLLGFLYISNIDGVSFVVAWGIFLCIIRKFANFLFKSPLSYPIFFIAILNVCTNLLAAPSEHG